MHALFMTVSSIRSHFQVSDEIGAAEICGLDFFANRLGRGCEFEETPTGWHCKKLCWWGSRRYCIARGVAPSKCLFRRACYSQGDVISPKMIHPASNFVITLIHCVHMFVCPELVYRFLIYQGTCGNSGEGEAPLIIECHPFNFIATLRQHPFHREVGCVFAAEETV